MVEGSSGGWGGQLSGEVKCDAPAPPGHELKTRPTDQLLRSRRGQKLQFRGCEDCLRASPVGPGTSTPTTSTQPRGRCSGRCMATGVTYWSAYESSFQVNECVWAREQDESSGEEEELEEGGGITWETQAMEVKGQLISAPEPFTCPDRKQRERMAELQERRRSLQSLLSTRLAELRRVCLQEAELTGVVPSDFPLGAGEKAPCIRRRRGGPRHASRKYREEEDCQRTKSKKTLFSTALRKHSDSEAHTHTQTHTYNSKRTVHRGCHTDDTVRSESSSTDSTGHEHDDYTPQCRPLLVSAGSPVEVFYQNKTRRNSVHNRNDPPDTVPTHRPHQLPTPLGPPHTPHPPPLPPRSQDSSSSSGPSDPGSAAELKANIARHSNSSDGLLERISPPQDGPLGSRGTNTGGGFTSSEKLTDGRTKLTNGLLDWGGTGRGRGCGRGGGYSDVLLDYVWGKQQQLQRQQPQQTNSRQPTTPHQPIYSGCISQQPLGAPPSYRAHSADQRRIKVTRTKSCGPFLPVQQSHADTHSPPLTAIQPDPHPHLQPPRPPQLHPSQDAQLEEATRSIHKALALEGLRDWYLRNTIGANHQSQVNGKVNAKVKCQAGGGGALQIRRKTIGVVQPPTYQTDANHHPPLPHRKQALPHSATFHGHPLHARSVDGALYQDAFPALKLEPAPQDLDHPSPGTLV
ncbi:coiled-coil domain-containing protein 120 isoform X2 [Takifugu rubripes]|uniref:coiled-coil domain-containing protein 120 isoform X2 n=1 Tax=Takifugu rubripes TaxID=31033 RepID=UPI0011452569|nr:coiled-coil domain-containing protein 120-like isoform X2 [Takifugu rubripes]